jgi:hypothetical protein
VCFRLLALREKQPYLRCCYLRASYFKVRDAKDAIRYIRDATRYIRDVIRDARDAIRDATA